jgi:WD40 repeat protein
MDKFNLMISSSLDGIITAWDMGNYQKVNTINDSNKILCLTTLPGGYFASSFNGSIKLWDIVDYKGINILESQRKSQIISILVLKDNRIISGATDGSIIIWN